MENNFEFDDVKKVRKSLLIITLSGVILKNLIQNTKGDFEFFGFNIPKESTSFILAIICWIIGFYMIVLIIRFCNDKFPSYHKRAMSKIEEDLRYVLEDNLDPYLHIYEKRQAELDRLGKTLDGMTLTLDVIFPLLFGIGTIAYIWFF